MKELMSDGNILDRLSELPDSLILEILSLLEMRYVVRTTLLSKRWKDFWVTIPCLKFNNVRRDLVNFRNFVYRTLTLWRGTHLRKFSVFVISDSNSGASVAMDMALWVKFATERKVEDLHLCINNYSGGIAKNAFLLPQCLYECSSIRKLLLIGCNLQIRENVKWDGLTTLKLTDCVLSDDVMNKVLSSSPQLEDFTISCFQRFQNFSIRSSSLKKLSIDCFNNNTSELTIRAPNLQVLKYSGTPCTKFLLTDISSLTEVELSDYCFQVVRAIEGDYSFSPLLNVKLLTIDSWWIQLRDIVGLLESFSKLKMLIVNWRYPGKQFKLEKYYTESEANILKSNLMQLRTVVINWDASSYNIDSPFEFIGFLLKHATMIEKMVIRRKGVVNSEEMFEALQNQLSLQRSFPSVELLLC